MPFRQILLITTALANHPFFNNVRYTPISERYRMKIRERIVRHSIDIYPEIKYRAKIVLLAGEGYTVPEITEMTNTHMTKLYENGYTDSMIMVKVSLQR